MTKRILHGLAWLAESPSDWRLEHVPSVRARFAGTNWQLTDGRVTERHPSLDACAARVRAAADLALWNVQNRDQRHKKEN